MNTTAGWTDASRIGTAESLAAGPTGKFRTQILPLTGYGTRKNKNFGMDSLEARRTQTNAVGARADLKTMDSGRAPIHQQEFQSPFFQTLDLSSTMTAQERQNMSVDDRARLGHTQYIQNLLIS